MHDYVPCFTQFSDNGKKLSGTLVCFLAFVPSGFMDSGWSRQPVFIHGYYLNRREIVAAVRASIRTTEITGIDWESIELYPYFGEVEWWMAIYKKEVV